MEHFLASSANDAGFEMTKVPPLQSVENTTPVHAATSQLSKGQIHGEEYHQMQWT